MRFPHLSGREPNTIPRKRRMGNHIAGSGPVDGWDHLDDRRNARSLGELARRVAKSVTEADFIRSNGPESHPTVKRYEARITGALFNTPLRDAIRMRESTLAPHDLFLAYAVGVALQEVSDEAKAAVGRLEPLVKQHGITQGQIDALHRAAEAGRRDGHRCAPTQVLGAVLDSLPTRTPSATCGGMPGRETSPACDLPRCWRDQVTQHQRLLPAWADADRRHRRVRHLLDRSYVVLCFPRQVLPRPCIGQVL